MTSLRLKTLGGALIEGPSGPVVGTMTQRRRLAVLSLLAASGGGISRDRLVGLLWPESDEDRARHALSQLLHSLRRDLGEDLIDGSPTALRLNPSVLSSDVQDFSAAIASGDFARAADLYQGPFLDGFFLSGCADFERWVDERRAAFAHQAEDAIEALAKRETDAGRATSWWRRLAALRPLDSRVALALIRSAARSGDRSGALDHARVHTELLRAEIDATPPPELTAFVESLRVAPIATPAAPAAAMPDTTPRPTPRATPIGFTLPVAAAKPSRWSWRSPVGGAAFATIVIAGTGLAIGLRSGGPAGAPPRSVIITDAVNNTNDAMFDRTIPVALAASVVQSPRLRVVSPDQIGRALARMRRPGADSLLDEKLAREIAERDGVPVVAVPAINRADSAFELSTKFVDPATGGVLGFATERAATRADVLDALDRLGRRIRRELGESRWSVYNHSVPLPRVTTTSIFALKKFADGDRALRETRVPDAEVLWTEAVALDSTFAIAHANLGMLAFYNNNPTRGEAHYAHALRHLGGLPEREQVFIRAAAKRGRNDFAGAAELLRLYLHDHPDDIGARNALGYDYMRLGRSADAIAALTQSLAVDSLDYITWLNVATAQNQMGNHAAAINAYHKAFKLSPAHATANDNVNLEYASAYVRAGQLDSARAVIELLAAMPDGLRRARAMRSMAFLSAFRGHYAEAAIPLAQAIPLYRADGRAMTSEVRNHLLLATVFGELGRPREAARALDSAFTVVMRMDAEAVILNWVGKALARAGDTRRSEQVADRLAKKVREGSPTDRASIEGLRGEILVARGRAADAMPHFEAAFQSDSTANFLESLAFGAASAGDLERAAAMYGRLGAGEVRFGSEAQFMWRLAPYWLARVYERASKTSSAIAAYERFLASWKDAGADLSSVADARERVARLRRGG